MDMGYESHRELYLAKVVLITFFELLVQKLFEKGLNFRCELQIRYTAGHDEN